MPRNIQADVDEVLISEKGKLAYLSSQYENFISGVCCVRKVLLSRKCSMFAG